jgi:hypothetical protein
MQKLVKLGEQQNDEVQLHMLEDRERKSLETLVTRLQYLLPGALQRTVSEILRLRKE